MHSLLKDQRPFFHPFPTEENCQAAKDGGLNTNLFLFSEQPPFYIFLPMKSDALKQYVALRETLLKEKSALEARLEQISRALDLDGGAVERTAGGRVRNPMSLKIAVTRVTKGKALNKQEILAAIKKLGYRFSAKEPINSLNTVLYTGKVFKNQGGKFSPA